MADSKKQKFTHIKITKPAHLKRLAGLIQEEVFLQFEYGEAPDKGYRLSLNKNTFFVRKDHVTGTEASRIVYAYPKYAQKVARSLDYGNGNFSQNIEL